MSTHNTPTEAQYQLAHIIRYSGTQERAAQLTQERAAQLIADSEARAVEAATRDAQAAGNALFHAIYERMTPHFPTGSRDLDWDVLPSTIGATCKALAAAKAECNRLYESSPTALDALTAELTRLRTELALLREWQREVIQNANAHHAERREAIARAERAEEQLALKNSQCEHAERAAAGALAERDKAEAALAFIASNGGTTHETECGPIACNGSWCAEQAKAAIPSK